MNIQNSSGTGTSVTVTKTDTLTRTDGWAVGVDVKKDEAPGPETDRNLVTGDDWLIGKDGVFASNSDLEYMMRMLEDPSPDPVLVVSAGYSGSKVNSNSKSNKNTYDTDDTQKFTTTVNMVCPSDISPGTTCTWSGEIRGR